MFRAAYTLEVKRRDNDKKIMALFKAMKEMMDVLLEYEASIYFLRLYLLTSGQARTHECS